MGWRKYRDRTKGFLDPLGILPGASGDTPAPPPSSDLIGAAKETAEGNRIAAQEAVAANRVNQVGPNGSLTYSQADPNDATSQWTATTTLSPEQQQLQDLQNQSGISMGGLANQGLQNAQGLFADPTLDTSGLAARSSGVNRGALGGYQTGVDRGGLGDYQTSLDTSDAGRGQAQEASYRRATSMLDPQFDQSSKALENQLANQGITRGSEAYNNAMGNFGRERQQAYGDARDRSIEAGNREFQAQYGRQMGQAELANRARGQSFGEEMQNAGMFNMGRGQSFAEEMQNAGFGNQARESGLQEEAYLQDRPLALINALRSGGQPQGPQFQNVPQQATAAGANILGATQAQDQAAMDRYNATVGGNNSRQAGLMNLAGGVMGMFGGGG